MKNIYSFNINGVDSSISLADSSNNGLMSSESYNMLEETNIKSDDLEELSKDIATINGCIQIYDKSIFTIKNKYLIASGAEKSDNVDGRICMTDFIEIEDDCNYIYFDVARVIAEYIVFYDSDQTTIISLFPNYTGLYEVPTNAKYFRASNLFIDYPVNDVIYNSLEYPHIYKLSTSVTKLLENEESLKTNIDVLNTDVDEFKENISSILTLYIAGQIGYSSHSPIYNYKDYFTQTGYIDIYGTEHNGNFLRTDYIEIPEGYDTIVGILSNYSSCATIFYTDEYTVTNKNHVQFINCYTSKFYCFIPEGSVYVRFSTLKTTVNNNISVLEPTFMFIKRQINTEHDLLLNTFCDKLDILNINNPYTIPLEYWRFDDNIGFGGSCKRTEYINVIDYTVLTYNASCYANAYCIELDQQYNIINSWQPTITNIEDANNIVSITLNSKTAYIGLSTLYENVTYNDISYYKPVNDIVILSKRYMTDVQTITKDDFVIENIYVNSNTGKLNTFTDGGIRTTNFIDVSNVDTIIIKRLSAWVTMGIGFYTDADETTFISSAHAKDINTRDGSVKTISIPSNGKYMCVCNSFEDYTYEYEDETYKAVAEPIIYLYKKDADNGTENTTNTINSVNYDSSFMGEFPYAIPNDFDYAQVICYGQSFADGGSSIVGTTDIFQNAYMLSDGTNGTVSSSGTLQPLQPVLREFPVVSCVNTLAALYNRYNKNDNQKWIATTGGANGRVISYMSKGTDPFTKMETICSAIQTNVTAEDKTVGCVAIIWMQGESDYTPNSVDVDLYTNDKDEYKARLLQIKNDLQELVMTTYNQTYKPLFFVYETSGSWIRYDQYTQSQNETMPITMAQYELSQENDDVILISPAYFVTMYNNNHPTANGYRWFGEMAAKSIWQTLNKHIRYSNTRPCSIKWRDTKIFIECYTPVAPLKFDTYTLPEQFNYGFQVLGDSSEITIQTVTIENNTIIIETDVSLSDYNKIEISYGGRYRNGSGNICDSDNWKSIQRYLDIDDTDTGNSGSATISQMPYDKDGNTLEGQHYPMNNFLANFYFDITNSSIG